MKFKYWLNEQIKTGVEQFKNYSLHYEIDGNGSQLTGYVIAKEPPNEATIGYLSFSTTFSQDQQGNEGIYTIPGSIKVEEQYRRKGLATAMYSLAEKLSGYRIIPNQNNSIDAKAVWNQPNRPFGK